MYEFSPVLCKRYVLAGKVGSCVIHPKTWMLVVTIEKGMFPVWFALQKDFFQVMLYTAFGMHAAVLNSVWGFYVLILVETVSKPERGNESL
jgi:hypothetical protein